MALVIAGISGDLARRKLLPALKNVKARGEMPFDRVIGTTRRDVEGEGVEVRRMDIGSVDDCKALAQEIGTEHHVFYLAVPPGTAPQIAGALSSAGFDDSTLVLEKPFGFDASSASREARDIAALFPNSHVLRVDHYLCKTLARDVVGKGKHARSIKIFASETDDVLSRADFYEKTGALRDFGNHLLSLAALALGGASAATRLEALKTFEVIEATHAQYEGYVGAAETFVELKLRSSTTDITLASGKALAEKSTKVLIDEKIFADGPDDAYEKILLAAAQGDAAKFLTIDEVAQSWRIMDATRAMWKDGGHYPRTADILDVCAGRVKYYL